MKSTNLILVALSCLMFSCSNDLNDAFEEENLIQVEARAVLPSFIPEDFEDNTVLMQEIHRLYRVIGNLETLEDVTSAGWDYQLTPYFENMGFHYANMADLEDGKFKVHKPEVVLVGCTEEGDFKALGVEYIVGGDPETAPRGFSGDWDQWKFIDGVGWTLHVWLLYENPDGFFNGTNSKVPVTDNCSGS